MMIVFKRKEFTIPEGHYTGPKDMDKVPGAFEIIGKSALAGTGLGGIIGGISKESSVLGGAVEGGKYGTLAGIILKFFLNYLHNPMSSIKYQEVDKLIRREFGIYRMSGITVGDSLNKRATLDEKFSFNDRNVTNYKINFSIQNDAVTMYTLGLTDKELDKTSKILDYYCKKYVSMEYTSIAINPKVNSYSVSIVFTNYQVISNFIMELSNSLNTKINLLDNKALVENRIRGNEVEKTFSTKLFNKYDLMKILGGYSLPGLVTSPSSLRSSISGSLLMTLKGSLEKLGYDELSKIKDISTPRKGFGNRYLEDVLNKLHYVENYDYTVGDIGTDLNMSLFSGVFLITIPKSNENVKKIDNNLWKKLNNINRSDTGKVIVYSYVMNTKNEFEYLIKKLMSLDLKPNIFEK